MGPDRPGSERYHRDAVLASFTQTARSTRSASAPRCFIFPMRWSGSRQRRKDRDFFGLPDVLDLLVVCVEAGLGLDQAMRKVSEEMKNDSAAWSPRSFRCATFNCKWDVRGREVLQELGARTGVDDLRSLAAILIQADKFGSSVAQALRVQSDSMRTRRRQLAEEKAAKTAVKLIFPLVIFIFPAIFVVLVGPAAITIVNEMFPMMNGTK